MTLLIVSICFLACGGDKASDNTTMAHQKTQPASLYTADVSAAQASPTPTDQEPASKRGVVFFEHDSAELSLEARLALESDVEWLLDHPDRYIIIHGYSDDHGDETHNLRLGNARANAVREYFIANGISIDRLTVVSHGETGPELPDAMERRAVFVSEKKITRW